MVDRKNQEAAINNENRFATIFVDESENKFDDDMFKQSPFFVYAWLLLTKGQQDDINKRTSELLRNEGVPMQYCYLRVNFYPNIVSTSSYGGHVTITRF